MTLDPPQHHERREEEGSRVGQAFAFDIGGRSVNGFEDGRISTNVTRGSETKTTNQTSRQVRKDITVSDSSASSLLWFHRLSSFQNRLPRHLPAVCIPLFYSIPLDSVNMVYSQVWHDHDSLGKRRRIRSDSQTNSIKKIL